MGDEYRFDLQKKIVVVGDGGVGKTCLVASYAGKEFDSKYIPTVFDNYTTEVEIQEKKIGLSIWDTAGQEEYKTIRVLSYNDVHCFILCFSVIDEVSYKNARDKWKPELTQYCPSSPILLVGTKQDLRGKPLPEQSDRYKELDYEQGQLLQDAIQAEMYLECSAISKKGVKAVFDNAIMIAVKERKPPRRCVLF